MISDNETTHYLKIKAVFGGEVFFLQIMAHHISKWP